MKKYLLSTCWKRKDIKSFKNRFFSREKSFYNPDFLRNYIPNVSSFIGNNLETLNKKTFSELHILLGKDILINSQLGTIKDIPVKIGASTYTPLTSKTQLKTEFDLFLEKLNSIQNPFEKALFTLVFIPYFQIFFDINKHTSHITCNIPLIQAGFPPLSLLQVPQRDYINAILGIYELNDPSLMASIFTENYFLNIDRYI